MSAPALEPGVPVARRRDLPPGDIKLRWRSTQDDDAFLRLLGDADACVSFDTAVTWSVEAARTPVTHIDNLLSWGDRAAVHSRVPALIETLAASPVREVLIEGHPLFDSAEYQLRLELSNALRAFVAGRRAGEAGFRRVVADDACPSSLLWGAQAGLAADRGEPLPGSSEWVPMYRTNLGRSAPARFAAGLLRARALVPPLGDVRLVAMPYSQLTRALLAVEWRRLRAMGLAVSAVPGASRRPVLRLAARGFPVLAHRSAPPPRHDIEVRFPSSAVLDETEQLDLALKRIVVAVMEQSVDAVGRGLAATRALDRLPAVRALLVPTSAVGSMRPLRTWATSRGVELIVYQTGAYNGHNWEGGDRLADTLLTWGARNDDFVSRWSPRPTTVPLGAPSFRRPMPRSRRDRISRVVVATTHASRGPALVPYGFCERFVETLALGLRRLQQAGVDVRLRIHPSEKRERYEHLLDRLGLRLAWAPPSRTIAEASSEVDLLVSSPSSVAFEAGAAGLPVALWTGAIPDEVRAEHLMPPLSDVLPSTFADPASFDCLAQRALEDPEGCLADASTLAQRLGAYVEPFDVERFAQLLEERAA